MIVERNEEKFFSDLEIFVQKIVEKDFFVVVHHYDADGLSSGAITIKALERAGKKVSSVCLKQLYKENIEEIRSLGKTFVFVDFGSGQTNYLYSELGKDNVFILDHHQPSEEKNFFNNHINPFFYGLDGGKEISGSGIALFFALTLDKKNSDLSSLAVVGAVGDMQDFSGQLNGLNRKILEISVKGGVVSVKKDLRLYGRISRPLISYLCFSSNPIIPLLTANSENCKNFLLEKNIPLKDPFTDEWISYEDLSSELKIVLSSALITHLSDNGVEEWKIKELVGEVYTLEKELPKSPLRDAKEFATLLNSTARHGEAQIGLDVCLGDRNPKGSYGKALFLLEEHKRELKQGIDFIEKNGVQDTKEFYFFDSDEEIRESLVGIIAGMLYGSVIQEDKPIIAFARNKDSTIKVSGRATKNLLRKGINLGRAFKELEPIIPGLEGGGHKIAAGCKFPQEHRELFLKKLGEKLAEQKKLL